MMHRWTWAVVGGPGWRGLNDRFILSECTKSWELEVVALRRILAGCAKRRGEYRLWS